MLRERRERAITVNRCNEVQNKYEEMKSYKICVQYERAKRTSTTMRQKWRLPSHSVQCTLAFPF